MNNINKNEFKKPATYDKIPLKIINNKGGCHMFTGLKKHLYKKPDRALIYELHLNNAYMYFCSLSYDEVAQYNRQGKRIIDHSTLVKIRARLGHKKIEAILKAFTTELIDKKIIDGRYLFTDTTTLEKNIAYPT